jgi:hypothetical protein
MYILFFSFIIRDRLRDGNELVDALACCDYQWRGTVSVGSDHVPYRLCRWQCLKKKKKEEAATVLEVGGVAPETS